MELQTTRPPSWKILLAFAIIYFVWGSTYLAIRVGVREVPPFLLAAMRFTLAGIFLYAWMRLRGTPAPSLREWVSATFLGALTFLLDYGCLFWAEQRIPSGIAAVVLATIPVFITLLEIIFLRTQRLTVRLALALLVGLCGVAVLMNRSFSLEEAPINRAGAVALLIAAFTWSVATILTRRLALPASKPMSAAAQMLSGGIQLFVLAGLSGEFSAFHVQAVSWNAWFSLIYLIIAGSIVGFTAYIWLLHYESPTKVGTYAYVNPVVAVALGYLIGNEAVGLRTLLGAFLILISVITITTMPKKRELPARENEDFPSTLPPGSRNPETGAA
ncbi:MAG: EamA family transporter [Candidatus Acidiferrales bacterium]|jgi:drug/metabolite transporter (DMT)-like permease